MNLSDSLETLQATKKKLDLEDLKAFHQDLSAYISSRPLSHDQMCHAYTSLNKIHDELMTRALQLAEESLQKKGVKGRPKKLCWVLFGSGARNEQTIVTDQDNGILYQCDTIEQKDGLSYVQSLAELGTQNLNYIGYPFCPGNVMATNKRWSNETRSWIDAMKVHINRGASNDIKYLFIAADLRGLYGDVDLVQETKKNLFYVLQSSSFILKRMHEHIREPKVSIGVLGNILTERFGEQSGKFNVKIGYYVPLVNTLKFLAIKHGIYASSSLDRLEALEVKNVICSNEASILKQTLDICLYFRWLATLNKGEEEQGFIDLRTLSDIDLDRLKVSLKEVKAFQAHVIKKVERYE